VKAEKEESVRLRKIAASIAKEIKQFWSSVEKVVVHHVMLFTCVQVTSMFFSVSSPNSPILRTNI